MKLFRKLEPAVPVGSPPDATLPPGLSLRTQISLGAGMAAFLLLSFLLTHSLIIILVILSLAIGWTMLRTPLASILGFLTINVILTLGPKGQELSGGGATLFDLVAGIGLAAIAGYWILKIRFLEQQQFSTYGTQLSIAIFFVWALLDTAGGVVLDGNPIAVGMREILNLMPLLILPVLYEKYIEIDSKEESVLFVFVLIAGFIIIMGDFWKMHNNLAVSVYLYQMGRAVLDLAATCLIILVMASVLMLRHKWYITLGAILFLFVGLGGLVISMTRTMYVGTFLAVVLVLMLGSKMERRTGIKNLSAAAFLGLLLFTPFYLSKRVLRLLLLNTLQRFLTTKNFATDLSLHERFSEWSSEWHSFTQSPIFGHGFGASFRFYSLIQGVDIYQAFSHNSYLYILFKSGIVGGVLLLIPCFFVLYKGFRLTHSSHLSERSRIVVRAVVALTSLILFQAFTGPTFDSKTAVSWLALGWGYIYALDKSVVMHDGRGFNYNSFRGNNCEIGGL